MKQQAVKILMCLVACVSVLIGGLTNSAAAAEKFDDKIYNIQWKTEYETHDNFLTVDGWIGGFGLFYLYDKNSGTSMIMDGNSMPLLFWSYGTYDSGFDPGTLIIGQTNFATANDIHFLVNVATGDLVQQPLTVLKAAGVSVPESAYKDGNYSSFQKGRVENTGDEIRFYFTVDGKELKYCLLPNFGENGWSRMYLIEAKNETEVVFGTNVVDKRSIVLYAQKSNLTYIGKIGMMDFTNMVDSYLSKTPDLAKRSYFYFQLLNR